MQLETDLDCEPNLYIWFIFESYPNICLYNVIIRQRNTLFERQS